MSKFTALSQVVICSIHAKACIQKRLFICVAWFDCIHQKETISQTLMFAGLLRDDLEEVHNRNVIPYNNNVTPLSQRLPLMARYEGLDVRNHTHVLETMY